MKNIYSILMFFSIWYFVFSISDVEASEVFYLHQDHLGSTSAVSNQQGQVVSQQVYFPYGETRNQTSDAGYQMLEKQYTGQVSDQDQTGLYYYNARYYNPTLAKFTQADNFGNSLNRYTYVENNPVIFIDPSGNELKTGSKGENIYKKQECAQCHQVVSVSSFSEKLNEFITGYHSSTFNHLRNVMVNETNFSNLGSNLDKLSAMSVWLNGNIYYDQRSALEYGSEDPSELAILKNSVSSDLTNNATSRYENKEFFCRHFAQLFDTWAKDLLPNAMVHTIQFRTHMAAVVFYEGQLYIIDPTAGLEAIPAHEYMLMMDAYDSNLGWKNVQFSGLPTATTQSMIPTATEMSWQNLWKKEYLLYERESELNTSRYKYKNIWKGGPLELKEGYIKKGQVGIY